MVLGNFEVSARLAAPTFLQTSGKPIFTGIELKTLMNHYIVRPEFSLSKSDRQALKKHRSMLIWFTGLSGAGKSTLSNAVEVRLNEMGVHTYPLDGDNIRDGINRNLNFSAEDRTENIRRVAEISKLFIDAGIVVLGSFISPFAKSREEIKEIVGADNFVEIFLNTSLEECERRDTKGLYKKARNGEIPNFTGISSPYETPTTPDIEINTENLTVEEAADLVIGFISKRLALHD